MLSNLTSICLAGVIFLSCQDDKQNIPDTSDILLNYDIIRVDTLLNSGDVHDLNTSFEWLQKNHPYFFSVYAQRMLPLSNMTDSAQLILEMLQFFQDSTIQELSKQVQKMYPEHYNFDIKLKTIFQNFRFYFPDKPTPNVYTYITGYNYGVVVLREDMLGIGLDFFLGRDHEGYHPKIFPQYIQNTMEEAYWLPRCAKALSTSIVSPPSKSRLIDYMIHEGKLMYVSKKLLPYAPDSLIFPYASEKIEWMKSNELETWAALLKEELLYSDQEPKFRKLISPSPNGPSFMPPESPGEAGSWIGWRIVDQFMQRNQEYTLQDLINEMDSQKILDLSRYKPR